MQKLYINLCNKCEIEHFNHKIQLFKEIEPNQKRIEEIKNEKIQLDKFKEELKVLN